MSEIATTAPTTPWIPDTGSFGSRLALVRHRMGWNIKEAARECGIGAATWRDWEVGGAMPRNIVTIAMTIATRTGCDYLWLVHGPQRGSLLPTHEKASTPGMRVIATIGASTKPNRTISRQPTSHPGDDHHPGRPVRQTRPLVGPSVRPHTPVAV